MFLALTNRWTDNETKQLIELYHKNIEKFQEKKFKPKAIFAEIAKTFPRFNCDQVETKMKNLKKTYKSIYDNNKATGRGTIKWPYYNSMNEIFGQKPENEPLSIASSSLGFKKSLAIEQSTSGSDDVQSSETVTSARKRKCSPKSSEPEWFRQHRKDIADRHNEKMDLQREFLSTFKEWVKKSN